MKIFVSFGQQHTHRVSGVTLDKDSLAEIECTDYDHGRAIAHDLFGAKFGTTYVEPKMEYFPRGSFKVN